MSDIYGPSGAVILNKKDVDESKLCVIKIAGESLPGNFVLLNVATKASANAQVDLTLSSNMLITSFGQAMSPHSFTVVPLSNLCGNSGGSESKAGEYFKENNAGTLQRNKLKLISISYQGNVFKGILLSMASRDFKIQNQHQGYVYTFNTMGYLL